ncbi:sulfite reductase [Aureococcus anophagefferens]|nr:sulfite reductase [Aureococcus anophagefferens]
MTDSLGSLVENLRPHPSSLRKQVEARHKSAGEFSFYGPAGSDFGQSLCKPRTRDAGHFSPGPARYNYLHMTPELLSSKKRVRNQFFGLRATWNDKQARRRRRARVDARARAPSGGPTSSDVDGSAPPRDRAPHARSRASTSTAKQQDWPSSANFNTSDIQSKFTFEQYPRCNFGQSTTRGAVRRPAGASSETAPQVAALLRPAAELVPVDDQERLRRHNPNQP